MRRWSKPFPPSQRDSNNPAVTDETSFALAASADAAGACQVGVIKTSGINPETGLEWTPVTP